LHIPGNARRRAYHPQLVPTTAAPQPKTVAYPHPLVGMPPRRRAAAVALALPAAAQVVAHPVLAAAELLSARAPRRRGLVVAGGLPARRVLEVLPAILVAPRLRRRPALIVQPAVLKPLPPPVAKLVVPVQLFRVLRRRPAVLYLPWLPEGLVAPEPPLECFVDPRAVQIVLAASDDDPEAIDPLAVVLIS
jgi:hypothetical protein